MPDDWRIEIASSAARSLSKLPKALARRIDRAILALAADPWPGGSRKLHGRLAGSLRIRCGRYRVIYEVFDDTRTVRILHIAPRKNAYRDRGRG